MALTVIPGAVATLTVPGHTQKFFSVSLNTGKNLIPVPAFGDTWETFIGGLKSLNGQLSFYLGYDAADSNPFDDASGTMTITFFTGCSISFTAIVGNTQIGADVNGVPTATMSFAKGDNTAPTIAWDETSS